MTTSQERWNITEEQREKLISGLVPELKTLRVKAHITQDELAKVIGLSRQTYCQIENGNKRMSWNGYLSLIFFFRSVEETSKLMEALGVYLTDLVKQISGNQ